MALLGVAGCSDVERPDAEVLRSIITAHCDTVARCDCAAELQAETCTEDLEARWNQRVLGAEKLELVFDDACLDRLVTTIERNGCRSANHDSFTANPLCESFCAVYHGGRTVGESCTSVDPLASDCSQGLVCNEGTCAEPCTVLGGRQEGEICATEGFGTFDDCASGLSCEFSTGRCVARAAEGESCETRDCLEGLECDWMDGYFCRADPEVYCGNGFFCEPGQYCENTPEGPVCNDLGDVDDDCGVDRCADGLLCNALKRCQLPPAEDEECVFGDCASGLVCDGSTNTCVILPNEGEACREGRCRSGARCETSPEEPEGICVGLSANDEMCMGHGECASGYCPNGFCWPVPGLGDDCEGAGYCAPGLVCNGTTCEATISRAPAACVYPGW